MPSKKSLRFSPGHLIPPFSDQSPSASASYSIHVGNLLGVRYKLQGIEHLQQGGGIVIINHQSFLDLIVLGHLWRHLGPAAVIAKKEILYYMPPIGLSIGSYGSIFIDRRSKGAAIKSIKRASEAIRKEDKKLIFFPEGTRSVGDHLSPFKNGAFVTAFDNQCKVFPVVVSKFTYFDHQRKECRPGESQIRVLEPVDSRMFGDFKELKDHCQEVMQREYDRLNGGEKEGGDSQSSIDWDSIWRTPLK